MRIMRGAVMVTTGAVLASLLTVMPAHAEEEPPPAAVAEGIWAPPDEITGPEESETVDWPTVPWQPDLVALEAAIEAAEAEEADTDSRSGQESAPAVKAAPAPSNGTPKSGSTEAPAAKGSEDSTAAPEGEAVQQAEPTPDEVAQVDEAKEESAAQSKQETPVQEAAPEVGATPMAAPAGTVAAAPGLGEQSWFSFQDFSLTSTDVARVNLANGNLLVKATDSTIAAPGYGLRLDRFYNGLSDRRGSLGGGWSLNNGPAVGLLLSSTEAKFSAPNGHVFVFTKNGTSYTAPAGSNLTLTGVGSDPASPSSYEVTDNRSGEKTQFTSNGYLVSYTDRNDVGVRFSPAGRTTIHLSARHDNGRTLTPLINPASRPDISGFQDSAGRQTGYGFDASYRLNSVTAPPYGQVHTRYTYDELGRLATITVPGSGFDSMSERVVTFSYDSSHRVTSVREQNGAETLFSYTAGETVVTDRNGNAATYTIDSMGRVESAEDALGRVRSQTWTANSDVATSTDAIGSDTSTYTYDGSSNRTGAQLPTGAAASAAYAIGADCSAPNTGTAFQPKCSTDDAGNKKQYEYDAAGNQIKQTDTTSSTAVTEFERTYSQANSQTCHSSIKGLVCSAKDANGNVTNYQYNSAGDLTKVTPPAPMGATSYTYDSLGRVVTVTDGNADVTKYQYDARDRIVRTTFDNTQYLDEAYYPNGATRARTDSAGGQELFEYDREGRITKQTGPQSGVSQTFTYDAAGNMLTFTDSTGTSSYTYDAANQLTKLQEPGGTCPASGTPAANSGCVMFEYDQNAAESKRLLPGGANTVTTRDNAGRPTRITAKTGTGTTAIDIGYAYTAPGSSNDRANVQARTAYAEQGIQAGAITTYSYDSRNRVSRAEEKNGATITASWAYTYDNAGNRTKQVRTGSTGATAGTIEYGYNAAHQLTSLTGSSTAWTYDGAGNQTRNGSRNQTATYGDRGDVLSIGGTANDYFGFGNTNRLSRGSDTYTSGALGLAQHKPSSSALQSYTRTARGEAIGMRTGANRSYYVQDHLRSVVGMMGATGSYSGGYSYDPYGERRSASTATAVSSNPLRYIGGFRESTGLYKLGARYYDPSLGRFTQMDPTGQEANPYAYAHANPISVIDPTGLEGQVVAAVTVSLILAGLVALACAFIPLIGCVTAGAVSGALSGGIIAGAAAAQNGASSEEIQDAFLAGLAPGAIAGAFRPLAGRAAAIIKEAA